MADDARTCPSCGARVPAEADQCDLCGTPVASVSDGKKGPGEAQHADTTPGSEDQDTPSEASDEPTVFCNQCGWENPPGARYCSQCGAELQDLSEASPVGTRPVSADLPTGPEGEASADAATEEEEEDEIDEQVAMGRQIAVVVGGALVLVLGLFFMTQWSAQYEWGQGGTSGPSAAQGGGGGASSPSTEQRRPMRSGGGQGGERTDLRALLDQNADSLTGAMTGQIDSLRRRVERASGAQKRQLQTELVNLLIGAGHPGRAAVVQKEIADATGTVDARRRTADLLYRWMQKLQQQGQRKQVLQVARHAAEAYATVAEQRPEDLDARTRMGEAYLLTNEPMRGIKAINSVLDEDSTFVPARFQKGFALLQINRLDQAMRQFEKVKQYADSGSPFYRQADRALTVIEEQRSGASSDGPSTRQGTNP